MFCNCDFANIYEGNDVIVFENEFLQEIKVDAYNWKTLYKCKVCETYWEERYINGRFGGNPVIIKVDERYVKTIWGLDYI